MDGLVELFQDTGLAILEDGLHQLPLQLSAVAVQVPKQTALQLGNVDPRKGLSSEVEKELRAFLVGLYLLDREDGLEVGLVGDCDQIADVGLFGHLEEDIPAELGGLGQDGRQGWPHDVIQGRTGVLVGIDAAPRRADNDCISCKGLYLQKVLIEDGKLRGVLPVYPQVVLQHFQFVLVDIVDHVFLEVPSQVDCYPSHSTKRFKDLPNLCLLEPVEKVKGNWLGYD